MILPFRDKFRARKLLRIQPFLLHVMLKEGKTWFMLEYENRNPSIANDNV